MTSQEVPDEVPDADALEQSRPASEPVPDPEVPGAGTGEPPLEASGADWQEQSAAEFDTDDDDDYDRRS